MIKKGMNVKVLTGKDKNKTGEIIEVDRKKLRAKVKDINMVKKHIKTTKEKKGGIVSKENFNCVVGFSGKIINKENLSKRITSKTKMLLLHGELDAIVSPSNLLDAKDFLLRNKVEVETSMISQCDHHISVKASSIALEYLKKNFSI